MLDRLVRCPQPLANVAQVLLDHGGVGEAAARLGKRLPGLGELAQGDQRIAQRDVQFDDLRMLAEGAAIDRGRGGVPARRRFQFAEAAAGRGAGGIDRTAVLEKNGGVAPRGSLQRGQRAQPATRRRRAQQQPTAPVRRQQPGQRQRRAEHRQVRIAVGDRGKALVVEGDQPGDGQEPGDKQSQRDQPDAAARQASEQARQEQRRKGNNIKPPPLRKAPCRRPAVVRRKQPGHGQFPQVERQRVAGQQRPRQSGGENGRPVPGWRHFVSAPSAAANASQGPAARMT